MLAKETYQFSEAHDLIGIMASCEFSDFDLGLLMLEVEVTQGLDEGTATPGPRSRSISTVQVGCLFKVTFEGLASVRAKVVSV